MLYTVGTFYAVIPFLNMILKSRISQTDFFKNFKRYENVPSLDIFELSLKCNWICISNEVIQITQKGVDLLYIVQKEQAAYKILRAQLSDVIIEVKPQWSIHLIKGRREVLENIPSEIKQCFEEARLHNDYDPDTIRWWDSLASEIRCQRDQENLKVGRIGEILSLRYEASRTGVKPKWEAIESDLSGYDILSQLSSNNKTRLKIEVKSSNKGHGFYLSRNQWETALKSAHYIFHFWTLKSPPVLYLLNVDFLKQHIPNDTANSHWEKTFINFSKQSLNSLQDYCKKIYTDFSL